MSSSALLERLQWLHTRGGAAWSEADAQLVGEVKARSWQAGHLETGKGWNIPGWLSDPELLAGRASSGVVLFVSRVLAAYRAGALGLLVGYDELAAAYGLNEKTFRRWVKRLDAAGVLEVLKTYGNKPGTDRRGWRKHLYRPGPALAKAAGLGLLEGAADLDEGTERLVGYHARAARRRRRERVRASRDRAWRAREARRGAAPPSGKQATKIRATSAPAAAPLSPDIKSTPTRPSGYGESAPPRSGGPTGPAARENVSPRAATSPPAPPDAGGCTQPPRRDLSPAGEAKRAWQDPGQPTDLAAELDAALARMRARSSPPRSSPTRARPREVSCESCGGAGVTQPGWRVCAACGGAGKVLR